MFYGKQVKRKTAPYVPPEPRAKKICRVKLPTRKRGKDDFSTPPKNMKMDKTDKKKKEIMEQKRTEIHHESKVEVTSRPKERLTTEEHFKQRLELPMAISHQEYGVEQSDSPLIVNAESTTLVVIHNPPLIAKPEENLNPQDEPPKLVSGSAQRQLSEESDKIEIPEEDVLQSDTESKTQNTIRRKVTKKLQYVDSDDGDDDDVESEFVPSDETGSDDSDGDFGTSNKSQNKSQPKDQPTKKSTKENMKHVKSVKVVNTPKVATPKTIPRSNLAKPLTQGLTKVGPKTVTVVNKTPTAPSMTSHTKSTGTAPKEDLKCNACGKECHDRYQLIRHLKGHVQTDNLGTSTDKMAVTLASLTSSLMKPKSPLDADVVLQTIAEANTPIPPQDGRQSRIILVGDPDQWRTGSAVNGADEGMDEEMLRTRRFWQKWGNATAKELLKSVDEELKKQSAHEPMFSARMERKEALKSADSCESIDTLLSLLTTSSMKKNDEASNLVKKLKRRKAAKDNMVKPDWGKMADTQRVNMLDKMISKDTQNMHGYMKTRQAPIKNIIQKTKVSDLVSDQERRLLLDAAYTKGLHGLTKSSSTANVAALSNTPRKQPLKVSRKGRPVPEELAPIRSPSPRTLAIGVRNLPRSESALARLNPGEDGATSVCFTADGSHMEYPPSSAKSMPNSVRKYHQGMKSIDIEGRFSRNVRGKINKTLEALDRACGYGDKLHTMTIPEEEAGKYTSLDYSRHPKYPQNVRIAPQLGRVIKKDIKARMGRPRKHEIRLLDIKQLNSESAPLDRSHRNLLIFNWLNSLEQEEFDLKQAPSLSDFEVKRPSSRMYPMVYEDSTIDNCTTPSILTRVSTAMYGYDGDDEDIDSCYSGGSAIVSNTSWEDDNQSD